MTSLEIAAPAKVNLFLKVTGKRRDSYHNILTLFERITLSDTVRLSKTPKGIVVSSDIPITAEPRENIAYKAAKLLMARAKIAGGVSIFIEKRIPIAAGLGGGSSDAAAVLTGMNRLFGLRLAKEKLMRLGSRLGADVPFFIADTPFAIGTGKGDRLKKIRSRLELWHLLVNPGFHLSTKEIYGSLDPSKCLTRPIGDATILSLLKAPVDFGTAESMLHNDLERIVVSKKSGIGALITRLALSLGKKAIVSGSGPSVFCLYKTRKEASEARKRFLRSVPACEKRDWQIFVVRTC